MMVLHAIRSSLQDYQRVIVAYSGGVDSHVLLHLLSRQKNIIAVHVNHQLNPKSNDWALHCKKMCDELNIDIHIEKINIELNPGDSLEEKAREARYAILKKYV